MTRTKLYTTLTDEELKTFDTIVQTLGYSARTDLTTALIRSIIYGTDLNADLKTLHREIQTVVQIKAAFFTILDEYAFAIIAMRGAEYAAIRLTDDCKTWMYDRCKTVPAESDIQQWMQEYVSLKKPELIQYRNRVMTANFEEEQTITHEE